MTRKQYRGDTYLIPENLLAAWDNNLDHMNNLGGEAVDNAEFEFRGYFAKYKEGADGITSGTKITFPREGIPVRGYNGDVIGQVTRFDPYDGHYEMRIEGNCLEAKMLATHVCPSVSICFVPANPELYKGWVMGVDLAAPGKNDQAAFLVMEDGQPREIRADDIKGYTFRLKRCNSDSEPFEQMIPIDKKIWVVDKQDSSIGRPYELDVTSFDPVTQFFHVHASISHTGQGFNCEVLSKEPML